MPLIWNEEYSVGNAELDAQHQKLMEICNRAAACLEQPDSGDLHLILHELSAYADTHFRAEEKLLEQCRCPLLAEQRVEHSAYHEQLVELMWQATTGEPDKAAIHRHASDWWRHHILGADRKYIPYIAQ